MTANAFHNISQIESSLWEAADQLRANSKLTSSEYCIPVLSVIFLRHATNRYEAALKTIQANQSSGKSPKRPLVKGDFIKRRALMPPEDNGEFFTPPSLVQTIVNIIEPDHGVVADLACGSGGMFVQSSHSIEHEGLEAIAVDLRMVYF